MGDVQLVTAQKSTPAKEAVIKNLVNSQQYVFYAQSALPMSGRQRFLTSEYTLYVSKDTVISDLPYFGRAYSAPINLAGGGINFTSTSFDYQLKARKKGGWDITIKPKDTPEVQQLMMTIFENGTTSLRVSSNNRQPISFNGYITTRKN
jgi:hypothetical protein